MDTDDTLDSYVPDRPARGSFSHPDRASDAGRKPTPGTGRRSIIRRLARQWPQIFLVWLVVSAPLSFAVYTMVEPTYEATSLLQADPMHIDIYTDGALQSSRDDVKPYLLTQVQLIASDGVLDGALAKPGISSQPMIRSSIDPKADLHKLMGVEIVGDNTYLIRVSLASREPAEAAAIVNAVVDSYIDQHTSYHKNTNRALNINMETELAKLEKKIQDVESRLLELVDKGKVSVQKHLPSNVPGSGKEESESIQPSSVVTEEQYCKASDSRFQADLDLIDAQARLDTAKLPGATTSDEKLRELETAVEETNRKRIGLSQFLARLEVSNTNEHSEQLRASILNQELAYHKRLQESVKLKLAQLDFEIGQEAYRISVQDKAYVPKVPVNNNRLKYMAVTPLGVLFVVFGLFLLQEIVSSRRSDREATAERSPRN
jgi:capsular polysaccharide biosynthesis protein